MSTYLFGSTVLMALLLVAIFVGLSRLGTRIPETSGPPARPQESSVQRVSAAVDTPAGLGGLFVVLAVAAGGLAVAAAGGGAGALPSALALMVGLIGLLLTGFLFAGTYVVVRQHGFGPAQGLVAGLLCLGGVGILVIAANLVFGFSG